MWQTDIERSEAQEQVGAERPDVLVYKIVQVVSICLDKKTATSF